MMTHLFQNKQIYLVRMPGLVELIIVMCLYANQGIANPSINQEEAQEEAEATALPPEPNLISATVESTESMSYVRCGKI